VGEKIIKAVLANSIADAIEYGKSLDEAIAIGLAKMEQVTGRAGFIVITKEGHVGSAHNCEAMAVASLEAS
jgi:isoaspartyl peptidase/L-asparaginase-like protein (Ntn-hydrolase superfamily)